MEMRYVLLALFAGALAGCQTEMTPNLPAVPSSEPDPPLVVDLHGSRDSLDWPGMYEGLLVCANCSGIHTRLTLDKDGSFAIVTRRLVRDAVPSAGRGQFEWEPDGNTLVLDTEGGEQRFAVGEGRLQLLEAGQTQPAWDRSDTILAKSSPAWRGTRTGLGEMLEDHSWRLVGATDPANRRIDALFPDAQRSFAFNFAGSRLHVQGGCNGFRGTFLIGADDKLRVTGRMSTLMACEPPLMEADTALSALMAEPLETVLVRGAEPRLVLLTRAGEALVLTGELTLEARFGAPTTVFLEIAAQTVACEGSTRSDGTCLQVRERTFDQQGLLMGPASEWQTFSADIEGYQHERGIRNIVRVKRFSAASGAGGAATPIYVLDLVVESEVVPQ
jgi:heat shock protein HslJ